MENSNLTLYLLSDIVRNLQQDMTRLPDCPYHSRHRNGLAPSLSDADHAKSNSTYFHHRFASGGV